MRPLRFLRKPPRLSQLWTSILLAVLVHVGIAAMLLLDHDHRRDVDPTATMGAGQGTVTIEAAAPLPRAQQVEPLQARPVPRQQEQQQQQQQQQPAAQPELPYAGSRQGPSVAGPVRDLPAGVSVPPPAPPPAVVAAVPRPSASTAREPEPESATQRAARPPSSPAARAPERGAQRTIPAKPAQLAVQPSFDCRLARSTAEKMICSDPELSRLDRDLGRLYARARSASRDPAAFRRQQQVEWRRREQSCKSRECLMNWYARRRQQLTDIIAVAPAGEVRREQRAR